MCFQTLMFATRLNLGNMFYIIPIIKILFICFLSYITAHNISFLPETSYVGLQITFHNPRGWKQDKWHANKRKFHTFAREEKEKDINKESSLSR